MRPSIFKQAKAAVILCGIALLPLSAQDSFTGGGCLAQSDGKGTVSLLWLPAGEAGVQASWQIQNGAGKVLLARVTLAEPQFLSGLSAETVQEIQSLARGAMPFKDANERKTFFFGLRVAILTHAAMARALGFSRILEHVAPGPQSYRIVGLDAVGKPTGLVLKSLAVDSSIATPLPAMPGGFRAVSRLDGVQLFWTPGPNLPQAPVSLYLVDRAVPGLETANDSSPVLLNEAAAPDQPRHVDRDAPVEREVIYSLCAVDVFGRRSPPVAVKVFHSDQRALLPPGNVRAESGKGKITLAWEPNPSPNTRKVFIERSYVSHGTYVALTPEGLPNSVRSYEDATVPGGATAFYRLLSVGPQGHAGDPSTPVSAKARNAAPPPTPKGLKAEVQRTRIRLTWAKSETPVALYLLERQTAETGWSRINTKLTQQTQFDDPLGEETGGTVRYRLKALAFDSQESPYCQPIEVQVPERSFPPPPLITAAESKEGKAIVHFVPGMPEVRSANFVVLRGSAPDQPALVLGRPLPAAAREYIDPFVAAGESYWYRVVALNAQGRRSEPSAAVLVTVVAPAIPRPQAPRLQRSEKPIPQVKIVFAPPPAGLVAVAERKLAAESLWLRLPGSTAEGELLDSAPPPAGAGSASYRVIFLAANGIAGEPSPAAELAR